MANPNKANSQLSDKSGDPMIGEAQTLIADPGAITNITAATPAQGVTVTSNAATDLDDAYASLALLENEVTALRVVVVSILDVLEAHGLMKDT